MTTSLAAQLAQRQATVIVNQGALGQSRKAKKSTRVSVLFDHKVAATLDSETVWATAQNGLQVLLGTVPALAQFTDSLFGKATLMLDRALLAPADAARHDERVAACLMVLSPHLQSRAALKLLEHLLRVHVVHIYNVDALMRAALPYHETPLFSRLVSFSRVEHTQWNFAAEQQRQQQRQYDARGAAPQPLSRLSLAKRCAIDDVLLQFVCESAFVDGAPALWISLYATVVLDLLSETARVDDALMHRLLPHALRSVRARDRPEHRHAGCLIVAQLCARASLLRNADALNSVLDCLSRALLYPDTLRAALLALAHVCRAQHAPVLPTGTVDRLLYEVAQCEATLIALHEDSIDVTALASLVLDAVASRCASGDERSLALAAALLSKSHTTAPTPGTSPADVAPAQLLSAAAVERFTSTFVPSLTRLQATASGDAESARVSWRNAIAVLRALDARHAAVLDGTIAKLLAGKSANNAGDALLEVVCTMLPGVRHTPMPDARCTLGAALAHPVAGIRAAALRRGGELLAGVSAAALHDVSADDASNLLFVHNAELHSLHDDDAEVVRAALDAVARFGAAFELNSALLAFLQQTLRSDTDARDLQRHALAALASATPDGIAPAHEWCAVAVPLVVGHLFETATNGATVRVARRICASGSLTHPLFAGMSKVNGAAAEKAPANADAVVAANKQVIECLARNVVADPELLVPLCCPPPNESSVRGRWLAVLVLDAAVALAPSPAALLKVLVPQALTHFHVEWAALSDAQRATLAGWQPEPINVATLSATVDVGQPSVPWVSTLLAVLHRCVVAVLRVSGDSVVSAYHSTDYGHIDDGGDDDDDESDAYALRFALRTVLRDALSSNGAALVLRAHLQAVLSAIGHGRIVPLLSSFWCTRPEQASSSALHISAALIAARGLPDDGWSTLLVTLLPPLTSKSEPLRVGALACLRAAVRHGDRAGKFVYGCVRFLLDMQHEVQLDGKVTRDSLATLANVLPANVLEAGQVALARAALAMPPFVAMPTMRAVQAYVSPAKAALVMPTLLSLVAPDGPTRLSTTRCKLVGVLLRSITAETAAVFAENGQGEQLVRLALLAPLRGTRRAIERMRAHVAEQLTPSLCRALPESLVASLFAILCRARREHAAVEQTARAITTALRCMPVSFSALEQALRVCRAPATTTTSAPTTPSARKRGRTVDEPAAQAAGASTAAATPTPASLLERLSDVLEAVHVRVTTAASDSSDVRLVGVLCGTLGDLSALAPDAARSYAQQLALSILLELVNRLEAGASGASGLDALRAQLDVDVLVETLRGSSDSSQTQRHVLLLLTELARLFPADVLTQVMPVFQVVGATAMRRDDAHSFQTIERTIRALVPAVVLHARDPDTEIAQLLDLFVSASVHVPAHRRPLLFSVLASTLAAQYLPSLVERLVVFAARVRDEQANQDGEDEGEQSSGSASAVVASAKSFDAQSLAADLLRTYAPPRVLSALGALIASLSKCQLTLASDDPSASVNGPQYTMAWRSLTPSGRATFATAMPDLLLTVLESSELLSGLLAARSAKELAPLQQSLGELFVALLHFDIDTAGALAKARRSQRHWWTARRQLNAKLLTQVGGMLDVPTLTQAIGGLLGDSDARVRRRAATLLAETVSQTKLRDSADDETSEVSLVVALIPTLLRRLNGDEKDEQNLNRQHMLVALDAIAASCAAARAQQFVELVPLVLNALGDASVPVAAAAFVLFATLIERLGARITPALPQLLPSLLRDAGVALRIKAAEDDADGAHDETAVALLRLSVLTTLHSAVTTLGSLLHGSLPQLVALLVGTSARADSRAAAKADATLEALSERVELRLLVAPLYTTFKSHCGHD
jgi:hypothetical protein